MKLKPVWNDINPKAVTTDELFGFLHPSTREWKDGISKMQALRKFFVILFVAVIYHLSSKLTVLLLYFLI